MVKEFLGEVNQVVARPGKLFCREAQSSKDRASGRRRTELTNLNLNLEENMAFADKTEYFRWGKKMFSIDGESFLQQVTDCFENLTCEKGEVYVEVYAHYHITKKNNDGIAYFILQIPYTPNNLSVEAPVWPPSFRGGDFNVTRHEEIAFLLVWVPRENITSGLNSMHVTFTLTNSTCRLDYYTYELDITFSTSFHESAENLSYYSDIIRGNGDRLYLFRAKETTLDVERHYFYMISQTTPTPDNIAAFGGKTWFRWDIKKMGSLTSNLVIIEIEQPEEKHKYEVRYSATWLMLGIGIPLTLSSILETVKAKNEIEIWNLIKTSKTLWLSLLILIMIFRFTYLYLVGQ